MAPEESLRAAEDALRLLGVWEARDRSIFKLSEGQKQRAVLAGLIAARPRLLLLDEPTANLDPASIASLASALFKLKESGLSLVIADHRLYWLKGLCQKAAVLEDGRMAYGGDLEGLASSELRSRLGLRSFEPPELRPLPAPDPAAPGVRVSDLSFSYPGREPVFKDFSVHLPYGRVTALTGPSGRGKTTLARLLCGLIKPSSGAISYDGESGGPHPRLGRVILQNADHQLYMRSALEEIMLALEAGGSRRPRPLEAERILSEYGLGELSGRHPQSLSGGERQRLAVAAGLANPARLAVLDEPTSGLDGRNLALMAKTLRRAADSGSAVLVATHDLELVAMAADHHFEL
jgi:energy-coupling factor transport system ATP-binding protein